MDKATAKAYIQDIISMPGWVDVIEPAILERKNLLKDQLVQVVLNPSNDITPAEIAGRIVGLEWLLAFVKNTIDRGTALQSTTNSA